MLIKFSPNLNFFSFSRMGRSYNVFGGFLIYFGSGLYFSTLKINLLILCENLRVLLSIFRFLTGYSFISNLQNKIPIAQPKVFNVISAVDGVQLEESGFRHHHSTPPKAFLNQNKMKKDIFENNLGTKSFFIMKR